MLAESKVSWTFIVRRFVQGFKKNETSNASTNTRSKFVCRVTSRQLPLQFFLLCTQRREAACFSRSFDFPNLSLRAFLDTRFLVAGPAKATSFIISHSIPVIEKQRGSLLSPTTQWTTPAATSTSLTSTLRLWRCRTRSLRSSALPAVVSSASTELTELDLV